jgi:hypothetical protein
MSFKVLPLTFLQCENGIVEFEPAWPTDLHQGSVRGMSGGLIFISKEDRIVLAAIQFAQEPPGEFPTLIRGCEIYTTIRTLELAHEHAAEAGKTANDGQLDDVASGD